MKIALYFSWAVFQSCTERFKWAAEMPQLKMVPLNLKATVLYMPEVLFPRTSMLSFKLFLCSWIDFTVVLPVAHKLAEFPNLEVVASVLDVSELLYVCRAADLHIAQESQRSLHPSHLLCMHNRSVGMC